MTDDLVELSKYTFAVSWVFFWSSLALMSAWIWLRVESLVAGIAVFSTLMAVFTILNNVSVFFLLKGSFKRGESK